MFSNRSVSVQPDAPHRDQAGTPEALSVLASLRSCDQVFGAEMPACLKAGTLYQSSDLLAALKTSAYSLPPTVPSFSQAGEKLCAIVRLAYVIGCRWCCLTSCLTRPGWAMSAMSGGCPAATAVASTVGRLLPFDW